jgi:peptidoglycan/LPS O-acetylase OafA/YrhL
LVYAGEVSFCFYLVHELVLQHILTRAGHGGVDIAILSLIVTCAVAVILHHAVELPCQALIRGKVSAARSIATHPEAANQQLPDS